MNSAKYFSLLQITARNLQTATEFPTKEHPKFSAFNHTQISSQDLEIHFPISAHIYHKFQKFLEQISARSTPH
jgi:hypothetical protein